MTQLILPGQPQRLQSPTGILRWEWRGLRQSERRSLVAWQLDKAGNDDGREWWPWAIRRLPPAAQMTLAADAGRDRQWMAGELRRVIADPVYLTLGYGHVQPAEGGAPDPFMLWPEQAAAIETMKTALRLIILKARQLGFTWLALHYFVWLQAFNALTPNAKLMVLSKDGGEASKLLARGRRIIALLPPFLRPEEELATMRHLSRFKLVGRGTMISLTSTPSAARSETATAALLDEAAFQRHKGFSPTHTAVQPSLGKTGQEFVISTGNGGPETPGDGQGFAKLWTQSREGRNDFVSLFLPTSTDPTRTPEWRAHERGNYLSEEEFNAEHPETEEQALGGPQGKKVYLPSGMNAVVQIGASLDVMRAAGAIRPPAGGQIRGGCDWGEHTHGLILWPLERGGLYVSLEMVYEHEEPSESSRRMLDAIDAMRVWPDVAGRDHLRLLQSWCYDSAGVQSQRTWTAIARRRHPGIRVKAIPFGAKMGAGNKGYKRETIGYLRRLVRRAGLFAQLQELVDADRPAADQAELRAELRLGPDDPVAPTQILAVSPTCVELVRQMRGLEWPDDGGDMPVDGDDHGPDALIAGAAPTAKRYRDANRKD